MDKEGMFNDFIQLMNYHIEICSSEGVGWEHLIKPLVEKYGLKLEGNKNTYSIDYRVIK